MDSWNTSFQMAWKLLIIVMHNPMLLRIAFVLGYWHTKHFNSFNLSWIESNVSFKINVDEKILVTNITSEGPFLFVHSFEMLSKVWFGRKFVLANLTLISLLSIMNTLCIFLQQTLCGKLLLSKLTFKWVHFFINWLNTNTEITFSLNFKSQIPHSKDSIPSWEVLICLPICNFSLKCLLHERQLKGLEPSWLFIRWLNGQHSKVASHMLHWKSLSLSWTVLERFYSWLLEVNE